MNIKGLESRIRHLEQRIKGGECDACTRTALAGVREQAENGRSNEQPCLDCGNPNPRIPLWVLDEIASDEEAMERAEEVVKDRLLKEHPDWYQPRK
jgi:hypothetical protein